MCGNHRLHPNGSGQANPIDYALGNDPLATEAPPPSAVRLRVSDFDGPP